jgi:hypothetical protein
MRRARSEHGFENAVHALGHFEDDGLGHAACIAIRDAEEWP